MERTQNSARAWQLEAETLFPTVSCLRCMFMVQARGTKDLSVFHLAVRLNDEKKPPHARRTKTSHQQQFHNVQHRLFGKTSHQQQFHNVQQRLFGFHTIYRLQALLNFFFFLGGGGGEGGGRVVDWFSVFNKQSTIKFNVITK